MTLTIGEHLMTSTVTRHVAAGDDSDGWGVSWLPGKRLDRNQAVSAVTLAEFIESGTAEGSKDWPLVRALAGELGLNAQEAVGFVLKTEP